MDMITKYNSDIYNRYKDLLKAKKSEDLDNNDLCKIFEYYSCIKLTQEYNSIFYEYADIDPEFKELNQMSKNDTGIDCCNLINTIVQCKLRKENLTWRECSTFFGSQNIYNEELNETIVRWKKLMITRNADCKLASNLKEKHRLFSDKPYNKDEVIKYCENLLTTHIDVVVDSVSISSSNSSKKIKINKTIKHSVREYQKECIDLIVTSKENVIIALPTGTGKNFIIVHSLELNKKYLILVPRIILMEQIQDEIKKYNPKVKNKIQLIGDGNMSFDINKDITICVYNSVKIVEEHSSTFYKIFVDEAHHILKPEIYQNDDEQDLEQDLENPERKSSANGEWEEDDEDEYEEGEEGEEEVEEAEEEEGEEEEEDNSDTDDEIKNKLTYISTINNFTKLNNNVYLSATIDKQDGFKYYEKNIRDMINNKYLCDYTINIPIFTDDPTNKNICQYLLKEHRNIIIYCNSQKEGKNMNELLNKLQNKSSEYIDCNTSKLKRKSIIDNFKSGELPFLVNVKILVEGFDAPITKGVCFMHLPSSKTTLIQIIGRALRLHKDKTFAKIILPFSLKEDESSIVNFMKVMAKNDYRIKKSFESKKVGGYISIENIHEDDNETNNEESNDINFKYELIFDSMGVMNNNYNQELWERRLEELKTYIDENGKRPSIRDKNINIIHLSDWIYKQIQYYKNKLQIMTISSIYIKWKNFTTEGKYKIYFMSNEDEWKNKLEDLKKYIDENNKLPVYSNETKNIKILCKWLSHQQQNFKNKINIISTQPIADKWIEFINDIKYKNYFMSNEDDWNCKLEDVKKYIDENNKRPSTRDKYSSHNLGTWISTQLGNSKKKIQIMSNPSIYDKWNEFVNDIKYKKYFISHEDDWNLQLIELKKYIDENKKIPSSRNTNKDIQYLGNWFRKQKEKYKTKTQIMANTGIYSKWTEFINDKKYLSYFLTNEELWEKKFKEVKKYIDENNKKPLNTDNNKDIKTLSNWISAQQSYKNENKNSKWNEFINDEKYKKYFISIEDEWYNNLNKIKIYIDKNNKKPTQKHKNYDINVLGSWIQSQVQNYKKKRFNMTNPILYKEWSTFINDEKYKKYFN